MAKNYASLHSNATLEFNHKSEKQNISGVLSKIMNAFLVFMVFLFVTYTTSFKAHDYAKQHFISTSYKTYHPIILDVLPPLIAQGYCGGGSHGYIFFSPTDHDKPIFNYGLTNYNITTNYLLSNTSLTNTKTLLS